MRVREPGRQELSRAAELARRLDLDYPGMENDRLWVAEEGGETVGLVALKTHSDCLELCALGVEPGHRGRGVGRALVEAVVAAAGTAVHLATVIPAFFEACGFVESENVPRAFAAKRRTAWCDGCDRTACRVMVRRAS